MRAFNLADKESMRPKFAILLLRKTVDVLDQLPVGSICNLIEIFAQISKSQRNDDMLKMLEPYVVN